MVKRRPESDEKVSCACGCGTLIPKYNYWGRETKFAFGHSITKKKNRENPEIECGCGCGEKLLKYDKKWVERKYIMNHNKRKTVTKDKKYEYVYAPDHPNKNHRNKVYKHRLVMEAHIGRYLTKDEIVHHKDEDPHNNDISNLEIMTRPRHKQHHWAKDFTNVYCDLCGKKTYVEKNGHEHWHKYNGGYICMSCYKRLKKEGKL